MSDLEKNWEEVAKQVNAKLKEATEALREVNRLTDDAGVQALIVTQWTYDWLGSEETEKLREKLKLIKESVSELEGMIDASGWNTSSSYC